MKLDVLLEGLTKDVVDQWWAKQRNGNKREIKKRSVVVCRQKKSGNMAGEERGRIKKGREKVLKLCDCRHTVNDSLALLHPVNVLRKWNWSHPESRKIKQYFSCLMVTSHIPSIDQDHVPIADFLYGILGNSLSSENDLLINVAVDAAKQFAFCLWQRWRECERMRWWNVRVSWVFIISAWNKPPLLCTD